VRLLELGCEFGQGYHFSRPVPAHELMALLTRVPVSATHRASAASCDGLSPLALRAG
jgi:predicted signal transduction protein with EAL and GGDEF domain